MTSNKRLFCAVVVAMASFLSCGKPASPARAENPSPAVIFPDGFVVNVDLAVTEMERARGLMFVPGLADDRGMFFIPGAYSTNPFWMKNCLMSLDLVWLDDKFTIVDISRSVPPCENDPCPNYYPSAPYYYVLEVRGGLSDAHGLKAGDRLATVGIEKTG